MRSDPAFVRAELAPLGKLRVALNDANFLLVRRDDRTGESEGVASDLGREIASQLEVPAEFVHYRDAGLMADAVEHGAWDVGFMGVEPARTGRMTFTDGYVEIAAGYLVPGGSPLQRVADVDAPGIRVAVASRSAYDLFLSRTLQHAQLVRAESIQASYELFVSERLDALASLKPRLFADARSLPGSRVLEGRFTAVQQAIGTPRERAASAAFLQRFVEQSKASGLIAALIARHGIEGVSVPESPPSL